MESLWRRYRELGVQVLVIDVKEGSAETRAYAERWDFSFPVLLDLDGAVTRTYAPDEVLPDLPRDQVPIASNLVIDPDGVIRFYSLLDSVNFDAKLVALQEVLREVLAEEPVPSAPEIAVE